MNRPTAVKCAERHSHATRRELRTASAGGPGGAAASPAIPPLRAALGDALDRAAPAVREHFLQSAGTRRYRGMLTTVWRRAGFRGLLARPVLWLCRRTHTFFSGAGSDVPFEMTHTIHGSCGAVAMSWRRALLFAGAPCVYEGAVTYDSTRGFLVEWLGPRRRLETELGCTIDRGELHTVSGRQWLRIGRLRIRVPSLLAGRAMLREWQRADGLLGTTLTIHSPLLGDFMGWEGWFQRDPDSTELDADRGADRLIRA
jgi:hypothetical protein